MTIFNEDERAELAKAAGLDEAEPKRVRRSMVFSKKVTYGEAQLYGMDTGDRLYVAIGSESKDRQGRATQYKVLHVNAVKSVVDSAAKKYGK